MQRLANLLTLGSGLLVLGLLGALPYLSQLDPKLPDPATAVQEAAELLQTHALNAAQVDWPAALARAQATATSSGRQSALDQAVQMLVGALNDGHSQYLKPSVARVYQAL